MKKDIHPENYRTVIFRDISAGEEFITRSCAPSSETATFEDGNEYPLVKLEISSASHPPTQLTRPAFRSDRNPTRQQLPRVFSSCAAVVHILRRLHLRSNVPTFVISVFSHSSYHGQSNR